MRKDNKNTGKTKEGLSKQEIYDALNSEPRLEDSIAPELSPLNQPVKEITSISNEVYYTEFCNWISNGYHQIFHDAYTEKDYTICYTTFPPEQFPEPGDLRKQTWKPISEVELELQPTHAKNRVFEKSSQHHVFLISILEAIKKDTGEFISIYASRTNKKLELKGETGIQRCIKLLINELNNYLEQDNTQLIPILYHRTEIGLMMSVNSDGLDMEGGVPVFEFGFSKTTSNAFTSQLITQLKEKLLALINKEPVKVITSKDEFDLTEKALILSYLQDANEFISSDEQIRINELAALLIGTNTESIKKAFQKVHRIKTGSLTSQEAKARLNNLKKILPVFQRLELPEMVTRIESRIKKVLTLIK